MSEDRKRKIRTHNDLEVFRLAMETAMTLFEHSKSFPKEERYSLTDQVRKSARSVCANIAEAWRKRRYERSFISKLSDAEAEAAETQVWIEFAVRCGCLERDAAAGLYKSYDHILSIVVGMIHHSDTWIIRPRDDGDDGEGN